jgi:hypothetical protein
LFLIGSAEKFFFEETDKLMTMKKSLLARVIEVAIFDRHFDCATIDSIFTERVPEGADNNVARRRGLRYFVSFRVASWFDLISISICSTGLFVDKSVLIDANNNSTSSMYG